ncbi:aminoglycoside phosphotransferase [Roseibacterium elongatum DSM 19469]|uniref:Aminoglycoside phosphotransferase n=1 Tax=Roseicyclus elongatus DSM 19469 TaxID=1294273 RepID=W8RRH3_9RHOB|nr:phosphotransferase [Roseibacterium elongatum]AHM03779.1 aminoglycoside phosphotransferase [Roseibacterium elongatum DSM 19469]
MSDRQEAFLERSGWGGAQAVRLAGDASQRFYLRLTAADGARAILMVAPCATPAERASLDAFRRIGGHLRHLGLSAPEEFAAEPDAGLILMEDLGDMTLSRLLQESPAVAADAYGTTARVLARLAAEAPPAGLRAPDAGEMAEMADLPCALLKAEGGDVGALRARLRAALTQALRQHSGGAPGLALRDVHGDNLIWLPDRAGAARIGLLDYQDALRLPLGYDLASLLDDVRRDIPAGWRKNLVEDFSAQTAMPRQEAQARIDTLSLQRNIRILGVFRRLATLHGKAGYARFLPRTRSLIRRALASPELAPLRAPVEELLQRTAHWSLP